MSNTPIEHVIIHNTIPEKSWHPDTYGWFMYGGSLRSKFCYVVSPDHLNAAQMVPVSDLEELHGTAKNQMYLTFRAKTTATAAIAGTTAPQPPAVPDKKGYTPDQFVGSNSFNFDAGRKLVF